MYSITFNGTSNTEIKGLEVVTRPNLPTAERNVTEFYVPGRNGALHKDYGTYKDIQIRIELNVTASADELLNKVAGVKNWLNQKGKLELSDFPQRFYKVKYVKIGQVERQGKTVAKLTPVFVCDPFAYQPEGETKDTFSMGETWLFDVAGDVVQCPVYQINGNGVCRISKGDVTVEVNSTNTVIIDTELLTVTNQNGQNVATAITGDIEQLRITASDFAVSFAGTATSVNVTPRWRGL